jgi:ClpP class serine protease
MMACTADELVANRFAVLGSVGVITEQPNVYERLKTEGVAFTTITAGKYKRTLTPTKKYDGTAASLSHSMARPSLPLLFP